jgi:hypothetical protein
MSPRIRLSPFMVTLAVVTLTLSSWGLFGLAHTYARMPAGLAAAVVAGFDLFAVAAGKHALDVAADGDSAAAWNLLVVAIAGLSAVLQYGHIVWLEQGSALVGVMMAAFPVATVCLFEGSLRRAHRLAGRVDGRVAQPRATFEPLMWALFPKQTIRAFRIAVLDRTMSADAAFKIAKLSEQTGPALTPPPKRREIALSYDHLSGQVVPDVPADDADVRAIGGRTSAQRGAVAAAVRTAHGRHGDNLPAVLAEVRTTVPDAADETVRRTLARLVSGQAG